MSKLIIKKGNLNYDQTGRAYPDNSEKKKHWKCVWENKGKYYKLVGLPYHADWEEIEDPLSMLNKNKDNIETLPKVDKTKIMKLNEGV